MSVEISREVLEQRSDREVLAGMEANRLQGEKMNVEAFLNGARVLVGRGIDRNPKVVDYLEDLGQSPLIYGPLLQGLQQNHLVAQTDESAKSRVLEDLLVAKVLGLHKPLMVGEENVRAAISKYVIDLSVEYGRSLEFSPFEMDEILARVTERNEPTTAAHALREHQGRLRESRFVDFDPFIEAVEAKVDGRVIGFLGYRENESVSLLMEDGNVLKIGLWGGTTKSPSQMPIIKEEGDQFGFRIYPYTEPIPEQSMGGDDFAQFAAKVYGSENRLLLPRDASDYGRDKEGWLWEYSAGSVISSASVSRAKELGVTYDQFCAIRAKDIGLFVETESVWTPQLVDRLWESLQGNEAALTAFVSAGDYNHAKQYLEERREVVYRGKSELERRVEERQQQIFAQGLQEIKDFMSQNPHFEEERSDDQMAHLNKLGDKMRESASFVDLGTITPEEALQYLPYLPLVRIFEQVRIQGESAPQEWREKVSEYVRLFPQERVSINFQNIQSVRARIYTQELVRSVTDGQGNNDKIQALLKVHNLINRTEGILRNQRYSNGFNPVYQIEGVSVDLADSLVMSDVIGGELRQLARDVDVTTLDVGVLNTLPDSTRAAFFAKARELGRQMPEEWLTAYDAWRDPNPTAKDLAMNLTFIDWWIGEPDALQDLGHGIKMMMMGTLNKSAYRQKVLHYFDKIPRESRQAFVEMIGDDELQSRYQYLSRADYSYHFAGIERNRWVEKDILQAKTPDDLVRISHQSPGEVSFSSEYMSENKYAAQQKLSDLLGLSGSQSFEAFIQAANEYGPPVFSLHHCMEAGQGESLRKFAEAAGDPVLAEQIAQFIHAYENRREDGHDAMDEASLFVLETLKKEVGIDIDQEGRVVGTQVHWADRLSQLDRNPEGTAADISEAFKMRNQSYVERVRNQNEIRTKINQWVAEQSAKAGLQVVSNSAFERNANLWFQTVSEPEPLPELPDIPDPTQNPYSF